MSGNLEAQYLAVRGQDPEEAAYQQSLAKAREEDSHEGILASLGHTVGEAASSLRDPERTGKNALVALFDMVKNTAQMGADVWGAATNLDNKRTAKDMGVQGEVKPVPEIRLEDLAPDFMQKANALRDEAAFGSTGGDVFTQKSLQFAIPFMGSMKLLGAGAEVGAMANLGKAVVADAAVSFSVWDPHEGRFADLLNTVYPNAAVIGPAIDFLASDPNDSAMEGRFKNALDSQLAGAAFSSFAFVAGKTLRAAKSGELFKPGPLPGSPSAQRGAVGSDISKSGPRISEGNAPATSVPAPSRSMPTMRELRKRGEEAGSLVDAMRAQADGWRVFTQHEQGEGGGRMSLLELSAEDLKNGPYTADGLIQIGRAHV